MKLGSLFSGVGGFDAGFVAAGFDVRWQCENDPACKDVLAARFPETGVLYDDIRTVNWDQVEPVDVIVGGFPCQDLSVAGRRAGLDGVRSGLFFEFARVLDTVRPTIAVIENVPGLLSSNGGRDMGIVLGTLRDIGAVDIAWCVLDAQWFGVPQRRRRVFILCDFAGERASSILALPEGLQRNPPPRRTQGETVAGGPGGGSGKRGWDSSLDTSGAFIETARMTAFGEYTADDSASAIKARDYKDATDLIAHAVSARGHASHREDSDTHVVVGAVSAKWAKGTGGPAGDEAYNLVSHSLPTAMGVRRLTPTECERLMGWPDEHTRWGASGKEMSDSTRYRMAGNGVVTPVAEWIARRVRGALQ